jgi:hypothetical protein
MLRPELSLALGVPLVPIKRAFLSGIVPQDERVNDLVAAEQCHTFGASDSV